MALSAASSRGWGSGWPNCQRDKIVKVQGGGITLWVRHEIADIVKFGLDATVAGGYNLDAEADDWGYACRAIRGSDKASNHSWGLAIDLNAIRNPMGSRLITNMPPEMVALWKSLGFGWGGDYVTRPDAMHFEFKGTPADAARITKNLEALTAIKPQPELPVMFPLKRTLWVKAAPGDDILLMKLYFSGIGYITWVGQQSAEDQRTFGSGTQHEVKRFQKNIRDFFKVEINVDGIYGPVTHHWHYFVLKSQNKVQ